MVFYRRWKLVHVYGIIESQIFIAAVHMWLKLMFIGGKTYWKQTHIFSSLECSLFQNHVKWKNFGGNSNSFRINRRLRTFVCESIIEHNLWTVIRKAVKRTRFECSSVMFHFHLMLLFCWLRSSRGKPNQIVCCVEYNWMIPMNELLCTAWSLRAESKQM